MLRQIAAFTLITGTLLSWSAYAQDAGSQGSSFYYDKERGWFWYEDPEPEPEPEDPLEPEPVTITAPDSSTDSPSTESEPGPPPGSVAWIRANLPVLRDRAIEAPTDENIQAYYYAQRLMLDMSERFARRANEVVGGDPFLDEDLRSPASNASADEIAKEATAKRDALLNQLSEQVAILFFYEGRNCRQCVSTVTSLETLSHKYGFTVMPISLDGYPLPGNPFGPTQYDTGLAAHLGVVTTPAIAIAVPPTGAEIVSYSAVSMDTAARRILLAAQRQNLITEAELEQTERINNIGLIDNSRLMSEPADIADSPAEFINIIKEEARRAFMGSGGTR